MDNERLKKHVCPGEHVLNGYLNGELDDQARKELEKHVANCKVCTFKIAEAVSVVKANRFTLFKEVIMDLWNKSNIWPILAIAMFILSFVVPRYFVQFLAGSIILAIKWIVDNKNTKMLIMIYDAWKKGGKDGADRIIRSIEDKVRK